MIETMGNLRRTNMCGELRLVDEGKEVVSIENILWKNKL